MKTIQKKLFILLFILPFSIFAQSTLKGTVLDNLGQELPGVSVLVNGTTNGVATDFDGNFTLSNIKKGETIVFSYVGFKTQELVYNNQNEVSISMQEDATQLADVVVVGYGTVKKKDATGSVALISEKDFNKGAITNTEGLISGRVAGVNVTQGGRPGDGAAIRIRGGSSFSASNDPLVVIDGLPVDKGLSSVNPNDIESFSILKDASATAIYGSRGSNGVILIKTKKGSKDEGVKFSFNSMTSINELAKKADVYSAEDFRNLITEYVPTRTGLLKDNNTDWQDQIFGTGVTSNNNFSARGNLLKVLPARFSLGYTKVDGVLKTSSFDRKTIGMSLTPSFLDNHLKFEINANYAYEKNRFADEGAIGSAISMNPTLPVYDASQPFGGYHEQYMPGSTYTFLGQSNPLALLEQKNNQTRNNRFYGNIQTEYKFHFLSDLKVVWNVGLDKNSKKGHDFTDANSRSGWYNGTGTSLFLGNDSNTWEESVNKLSDVYLNYNKTFGSIKVDLTGGYSWQNFENESYFSGNTLVASVVPAQNAVNTDITTSPTVNLQAFYGRANIDIANKYLITLNYRRDGTSRFAEKNRWGNFPGVAFAWKIANENFLKDSKSISDLKLRLGYGVTGQQAIPNAYDYVKRYNLSGATSGANYQFGNTFYVLGKPEGYNPNIKWEETTTINAGLDFGFFKDKLTGSIDVFQKESNDLIAYVIEPSLSNFRTIGPKNIGKISTQGAELGLVFNAIRTDKQNLSFNYNVSYYKQEVKDIAGSFYDTGGVGLDLYTQRMQAGLAPNAFWLYEQVYDATGKPIEGMYVDRNGDGTITSDDKYAYKKPAPDVTMGLMINYSINKWDFSTAFRSSFGNYVYDNVSASRSFLSQSISDNNINVINNSPVDFNNTLFNQKRAESDYYVKNASWLKWDNLTIGYTLSNPFSTKSSSLRLYTGAQNLLIVSKYKGMDPEIFGGIDSTIYPRARMYIMGLNFNF